MTHINHPHPPYICPKPLEPNLPQRMETLESMETMETMASVETLESFRFNGGSLVAARAYGPLTAALSIELAYRLGS